MSCVGKGDGGLCNAPTIKERRKRRAKRRERSDHVNNNNNNKSAIYTG